MFDWFPDFSTARLLSWDTRIEKCEFSFSGFGACKIGQPSNSGAEDESDAALLSRVYVPTADSARLTYLLHNLITHQYPICFVGTAGTGKTSIVKHFLRNRLRADENQEIKATTLNLNCFTDSKSFQALLEHNLEKVSSSSCCHALFSSTHAFLFLLF